MFFQMKTIFCCHSGVNLKTVGFTVASGLRTTNYTSNLSFWYVLTIIFSHVNPYTCKFYREKFVILSQSDSHLLYMSALFCKFWSDTTSSGCTTNITFKSKRDFNTKFVFEMSNTVSQLPAKSKPRGNHNHHLQMGHFKMDKIPYFIISEIQIKLINVKITSTYRVKKLV